MKTFARAGFCREQFLQALVRCKLCLMPGAGKRSSRPHLFYGERAGRWGGERGSTYLSWRLWRYVRSLGGSYLQWRLRRYLRSLDGSYLRWRLWRYVCSDNTAAHFLTRFPLFHFGQPIRNNLHYSTEGHLVIKLGDVLRFHADAAVTCRATDLFFLRRAVDINAALKRVRVARFQSTQPDDACSDRVAPRGVWLQNLTR